MRDRTAVIGLILSIPLWIAVTLFADALAAMIDAAWASLDWWLFGS